MTSSKLNYLPCPNTITLGVTTSTYEFWGDTNIQSITTKNDPKTTAIINTTKYIIVLV